MIMEFSPKVLDAFRAFAQTLGNAIWYPPKQTVQTIYHDNGDTSFIIKDLTATKLQEIMTWIENEGQNKVKYDNNKAITFELHRFFFRSEDKRLAVMFKLMFGE